MVNNQWTADLAGAIIEQALLDLKVEIKGSEDYRSAEAFFKSDWFGNIASVFDIHTDDILKKAAENMAYDGPKRKKPKKKPGRKKSAHICTCLQE